MQSNFLKFIEKLKKITMKFIKENHVLAYQAKLVIKQNYMPIDSNYSNYINWIRKNKFATPEEISDGKIHATQIDSIILLENDDIAVSGGPLNFEVLIYRM